LPEKERNQALQSIDNLEQGRKYAGLITSMYPDTGDLRRELYPKHLEFFKAGAKYRERCAIAANRIGKSEGMGGYETALHLTGMYPKWWEGKRFTKPIDAWVSGKNSETTRDIVQKKLIGGRPDMEEAGTMLIPKKCIGDFTLKPNTGGLIDRIKIKHVSGGESLLGFKSYEQGRSSFEGTEKDLIWFDEEPPQDAYGEALIRTMTTNGIVMVTFTPLAGISNVVLSFMPKEQQPNA
jgi:phage terminase large subunit-like protein